MYYNNHFRKLSFLHTLRVSVGMRRVMKMISVCEGKCEGENKSGDSQ